jgi:hypothetical protein
MRCALRLFARWNDETTPGWYAEKRKIVSLDRAVCRDAGWRASSAGVAVLGQSKESPMYMRIVRSTPQAGQTEEFIRRWTEYFGPRFEQNQQNQAPRHAHVGYDRERNELITVAVWDAKPDEAILTTVTEEFRPKVSDIMSGPPVFEEYEVLTHLER